MKMLPVCSTAPFSSAPSQILVYGGFKSFPPCSKTDKSIKRLVFCSSNGLCLQGACFARQPIRAFYSDAVGNINWVEAVDGSNQSVNDTDHLRLELWGNNTSPTGHEPFRTDYLTLVESSSVQAGELRNFASDLVENTSGISAAATTEQIIVLPGSPEPMTDVWDINNNSLSGVEVTVATANNFFSDINKSIGDSFEKGDDIMNKSVDSVSSSVTSAFSIANDVVARAVNKVTSAFDRTGELAGNKLGGFSSDLKNASGKVGIIAVDFFRRTILVIENSLSTGASYAISLYGSAKELLPPDIHDAVNTSEEVAAKLLSPLGSALQQAYIALEGLERSIGLDPKDPLVPFVLVLGGSAALWSFYWVLAYGGYAGDLSSKSTLELLAGNEDAVLIDIRPEDLRERDGIPDLRRTARTRYASITLPEVDSSMRKLLKNGKDVDNSLLAAVIRNLKIVQDSSTIIVMDADGKRSKEIARSLRKLGAKRPFLVEGGFRSWVKDGCRVKELRPETALTIFSEEAEAILEEIKPTPINLLGYGLGFAAAVYAVFEWEKTLQYVGILGLGQTLYRRIVTYENSEDFRQDVRLLLTPVKLGGEAVSWVAGKLDARGNGLPTSPSSSDVQSRVLKAAAKHESQPSDTEEIKEPSPELAGSMNETIDLSEA